MKTTCMKTSESCVLRVFANVMNLEWTFLFVCLLIITHGFTRNFFFAFFFIWYGSVGTWKCVSSMSMFSVLCFYLFIHVSTLLYVGHRTTGDYDCD